MNIDSSTKLMSRIYKVPGTRGILTYNNYLQNAVANAVCLPLYSQNLKELLDSMKNLNFSGSITVSFQNDKEIFELVDEIDPVALKVGTIGFVTIRNKRLKGYCQGGYGIMNALSEKINLDGKKIIILGAGKLTKGLLVQLELNNIEHIQIEIYNRTYEKAKKLASEFPMIKKIASLDDLKNSEGDIFINSTPIGATFNEGENYIFSEDFINKFETITDVNFIPLKSPLILSAEQLGKQVILGADVFKFGTKMCLDKILDIKADPALLLESILKEFA